MTSKFTITQTKHGPQSGLEWKPEEYQKQGVKLFVGQGAAGLFLDPGMRKTSISLAAIKILLKKKLVRKVLIIAPVRPCYLVWPKEIKKWKDFQQLRYSILHGSRKEEALQVDADIYLMNPEGLPWLLNAQYVQIKSRNPKADEDPKWKIKIDWERFMALGFDMLILDESTKFKNTNTERYALLKPTLTKFNRRYILTGSPMPRSYMDLFGQIYTLDLGNALGGYISHYRNSYFDKSGFGGYDWKLRDGADKEIQAKIKPLVMHFAAEDHLDMPILRPNPIFIDLPEKARRMYDEMEEHLITDNGEEVFTAVNSAASGIKCSQIANGGMYKETTQGKESVFIHDAKTEAVKDLIEELSGQPALLNYEFGHDLERLTKALGADTPNMSGSNLKRLELMQDKWNAGEIPVMLGQPASMGHGLNLQEGGHHLIMHSLMWDWEVVDQWIRRIRRGGNKHKYVFLHMIIARGTIDEVKYARMISKDKSQRAFLNAMKTYFTARKAGKFSALQELEDGVLLEEDNRRGGPRVKQEESKMAFVKKEKKAETGLVVDLDNAKFAKKGGATASTEVSEKKEKKAAKPAKAPKAEKPAANDDKRKITLVEKKNPKREGSEGYKRYALYKSGMKVSEFLEAGGTSADLRYDEAKGFIKVA